MFHCPARGGRWFFPGSHHINVRRDIFVRFSPSSLRCCIFRKKLILQGPLEEKGKAMTRQFSNAVDRRQLLIGGAAVTALLLPGCAGVPGFDLTEVIRRLLDRSSKSAFALMLQPGGFYDNNITRIALPDKFGGSRGTGLLSAVLQSGTFREKLQRQLNRAAEKGAERAAPLVADAVRNVSIEAADAIVRGGPQAASGFLRGKMGTALLDAMVPGISDGLRLFDDQVINKAVQSVTGFDIAALAQDVTSKADNAIWAAIGTEEAAIRADPGKTNDPLLIGVFGIASKV